MNPAAVLDQLDQQRRRVDFDTYDITVQQLIAMVESGAIDVAPAYQRQFRWDDRKRSHLVESVFLGVPVPSLFMATNRDGTWELVDGVQKLSTLIQFAGTESARQRLGLQEVLVLNELEKLSGLNGSRFADLPDNLKLQFGLRPIKVITLSDKSDMVVRFDLFERLNTGGVALTDQEIRACIYRGPFNEFLERLARLADFHKVVRLTQRQEKDEREKSVLCVLRFPSSLQGFCAQCRGLSQRTTRKKHQIRSTSRRTRSSFETHSSNWRRLCQWYCSARGPQDYSDQFVRGCLGWGSIGIEAQASAVYEGNRSLARLGGTPTSNDWRDE